MHKRLMILGLLLSGPLSGYRLHRIAAAHGELYRDLKKANLYYLLGRMEQDGLLAVRSEPGARGPRRERLVYSITGTGRREFQSLLRQVLQDFQPVHTGVEVATVLLDHLPPGEAGQVLERRREVVQAHRGRAAAELGPVEPGTAGDHLLLMVDAELAWLDRSLARVRGAGLEAPPSARPGSS
jgi:DNA-binding PadR family transcriptional regulator